MKIRWIGGDMMLPDYGLIVRGQVRDVPEDMGLALINQKKAVLVEEEK